MATETTKTTSTLSYNTPESWEIARSYAGQLGEISSLFGTAIRGLLADHLKDPKVISRPTLQNVLRLAGGDSMNAVLYFAARTYRPECIESTPFLSAKQRVTGFAPY